MSATETLECLDGHGDDSACAGPVEWHRLESSLSSGRAFPRCERHWHERLDRQAEIDARYPVNPPRDWSPLDAGEAWGEDDY